MINMQNFHGIAFEAINNDVRQMGYDQFAGTFFTPGSATMGQGAQSGDCLVDFTNRGLSERKKIQSKVIRYGFKIIGCGRSPSKPHQAPSIRATLASISASSMKSP